VIRKANKRGASARPAGGACSKIAEHGGDNPGDLDVPLVVYAPGTVRPAQAGHRVETTQVAPTILKLLGLSPSSLQAVKLEGTHVLPGL
jgi:arylsulfatase A-like enzyme